MALQTGENNVTSPLVDFTLSVIPCIKQVTCSDSLHLTNALWKAKLESLGSDPTKGTLRSLSRVRLGPCCYCHQCNVPSYIARGITVTSTNKSPA